MQQVQIPLSDERSVRVVFDNPDSDKPALVLLNGSVFNLFQYKRLVNKGRWKQHFRVIRYDYLGTGDSSARGGPVGLKPLGAELVELLDALELEQAHFYGMSQGTMVLQALAATAPERMLSACGYGWYHGNFSGKEDTRARIDERVQILADMSEMFTRPMDREVFDALWARIYRKALFEATWEELSIAGKLKDWVSRRVLYPLVAPTPLGNVHEWFRYCVHEAEDDQAWLESGFPALREQPVLIQHAIADQTLEIGMARELAEALHTARLIEYGEGYNHVSIAFDNTQAAGVVDEHIAFLQEAGALS